MAKRSVIIAISDLQIPFAHCDAFDFIHHLVKTFTTKHDRVTYVNQGDEVDQHTLSLKFQGDVNGMSGGDELALAREQLKPWFKAYPKTFVCKSNHTWRGFQKAHAAGIPRDFMKNIGDIYGAPKGWQWADRWVIDNIVFEHGENVSGTDAALKAAVQNRLPTSIGHQHSMAGVIHSATFHNTIWGMNTGCLIDEDRYAFAYGVKMRKKPTLGSGVIISGTPLFIPMILNHKKRWIKRTI